MNLKLKITGNVMSGLNLKEDGTFEFVFDPYDNRALLLASINDKEGMDRVDNLAIEGLIDRIFYEWEVIDEDEEEEY